MNQLKSQNIILDAVQEGMTVNESTMKNYRKSPSSRNESYGYHEKTGRIYV